MLIWHQMMHNFSYDHEHNVEHNRSKIRALHLKIIGKNCDRAWKTDLIYTHKF